MKSQTLRYVSVLTAVCFSPVGLAGPATVGELLSRRVDVRLDERLAQDAEKARQNYQQFLDLTTGDDALRTDALRRLGDLKLEEGEEARLEHDLNARATLQTLDAIRLYTRLLEVYPDYAKNDAVLYQLARAYESNNEPEKSIAALDSLILRYPTSPRAAEAEFRRGEFFFAHRQWSDAESAYGAVVSGSRASEFYEQSLYKLGWSRFKRGDVDGSLDAFVRLLDQKLLQADGKERDLADFPRPQRELIEDTLRVMAIEFSVDDDVVGVERFVGRVGQRAYEHRLYASLGDLYAEKERWTDAASAYRAFAKHNPDSDRAPLLQSVAIDVYKRGGFTSLVVEGKRDYVERYGSTSTFWKSHSRTDLPDVVKELKANITDLAAYYHEKAQSSKLPADYEEAARWYREVLSEFPADETTPEVAYMLADALFESGRFEQATAEYERVAYGYPGFEKSATAGYAALVTYERHETGLQGDAKRVWHEKALAAALRFATAFPDHPERSAVLLRTARSWFDLGDFERAADIADIVLSGGPSPTQPQRQEAWVTDANSQFELGHFDRAEAAYREALVGAPKDTAAALTDRLAAAIYRQAEAHRTAHEDLNAAEDFLRVRQLAPTSGIRATADFDAAAAFLAVRQWTRAIDVLETFRREHPASELQPDVTRKLAFAYTQENRFADAAREWERVSTESGTSVDEQQSSLAQAIEFYEKSERRDSLKHALDAYLRRFPAPDAVSIEYRQQRADMAREDGALAERAALLAQVIASDKSLGDSRTDRTRYLAAKASLELALPERDAVAKVPLRVPLKKSLEAKRAALASALKALEAADSYGVAEVSTAAVFEMAELYRRLGTDLVRSERPKSLAGEELEQYSVLLEEQAYPFEEKAIELHASNAARASVGVYDEWVRASYGALAALNPGRFGKTEETEPLTIDITCGSGEDVDLALSVPFQEAVAVAQTDPERAEREFARLRGQRPELAGPAFNVGVMWARMGRWADAVGALEAARSASANDPAVADQLGFAYRNAGRFTDAEAAYRAAVSLDATLARPHRNLAVLLDLYLGKTTEALKEAELALANGADDKVLSGWIAEMKRRAPQSAPTGATNP